uniref:Exostosin domain-containing protein n=1 Tax=Syphacia muris TaxID=451379 RepID=A0A0N5AV68_9BILA
LILVALFTALSLPFIPYLQEDLFTKPSKYFFRNELESDKNFPCIDDGDRVKELQRILQSVRRDLLEAAKRLEVTNADFQDAEKKLSVKRVELEELESELTSLRLVQKELRDKRNVPLMLPLLPPPRNQSFDKIIPKDTAFENAFDFSKCSIAGGFPLYLYRPTFNASLLTRRFYEVFRNMKEATTSPTSACIFIAFVEDNMKISELSFWRSGTNHVLLNFGKSDIKSPENAVVVSSVFDMKNYRKDFDISLYLNLQNRDINDWKSLPNLLPYEREYLISYEGFLEDFLRKQLEQISFSCISSNDTSFFKTNCSTIPFSLCGNADDRASTLKDSMFSLIFEAPLLDSSEQFHLRLWESLKYGAIPVVLSLKAVFPLHDFIDWSQAALQFPLQRLPELHFILRSISVADILEMRRQGRFLLENYFLNVEGVVSNAVVGALRKRVGVPGGFFEVSPAKPLFGNSYFAEKTQYLSNIPFDKEYLGPSEAPHNSPSFFHNFTALQKYSYNLWNAVGISLGGSPEFLPFDPPFPSNFEYDEGAAFGFRPIAPGSGAEFSAAIGGNRPREQFTVILLTYRREAVLVAALERLANMPYLNQVLPPSDRVWPKLHVPVLFIKSEKNSLNNRFIPYSEIKTEAVLSLDDDVDLKQHEIIFAFRVWREQRQKIIGFPARYHAKYDNQIYYNSNHTCQHSMILTGAAFLHKWYLYLYTYHMPEVIRMKVDEYMNCEDIAMNFLVAHVTRQPPIKTTSKWTIRCPMCSEMLSQDETHFTERHECIRFFSEVYGYNPLLFSQFRVDSVLFKTRLPPQHQKCFKYV